MQKACFILSGSYFIIAPMINPLLPNSPFQPRHGIRSASAQTILAMRRPRGIDISGDEQPVLVDAGPDYTETAPDRPVQLIGYFNASRQPGSSRGLVLLLHGWEGSSHSNMNMVLAQTLTGSGYDVFRLNLRDHGPNLHVNPYLLNPGLFLGTLLEEAAAAAHQVAMLAGDKPFYIMGASMGGNFGLRLATWHIHDPFPNLRKVVVVCPAIDPAHATDALDGHRATRRYFRQRWLRSLRAKQQLFPTLYEFEPLEEIASVRAMTDWLVRHHRPMAPHRYADADEYFNAYAVDRAELAQLTVATTIITAENDPVIPVADFYTLPRHPLLKIQVHPTGGHCGFVDILPYRHAMPDLIMAELQEVTGDAPLAPTLSPPDRRRLPATVRQGMRRALRRS
jgi:uncharacterized protein